MNNWGYFTPTKGSENNPTYKLALWWYLVGGRGLGGVV